VGETSDRVTSHGRTAQFETGENIQGD